MELVDGVGQVIDRGALGVVYTRNPLNFRWELEALIRKVVVAAAALRESVVGDVHGPTRAIAGVRV